MSRLDVLQAFARLHGYTAKIVGDWVIFTHWVHHGKPFNIIGQDPWILEGVCVRSMKQLRAELGY